jgi:DNA primase
MQSNGILDEIKNRIDIVELISDYIPLKRAGQNYKGLCPFHTEKTPSFMVSPQKQIFHCFGCGTGGDIFGFVMKYESLSFREALHLLAKKAGVRLRSQDSAGRKDTETIRAMQKEALGFFMETLARSETAKAYLKRRGIAETIQKDFSIGYAPAGWHNLYNRLKAKGFEDPLILQAGLCSAGGKGIYDIFRARIMFPIFNLHSDVIAFGGRVMDNTQPKYLNSPDTVLFKKGDNLYALYNAKEEIRKKDFVIVVEGYLDAIMCHQHGIRNAVAPLGTSLTEGQLKKLRRFTNNVLLVFDGDEAGVAAAKRSLALIFEHGLKAKILLLPEGEDPDSILREKGAEHMKRLISQASSPVDFLLKSSSAPMEDTINEAIAIIAKVNDPILTGELVIELSDRTRRNERDIREKLNTYKKTGTITGNKPKTMLYNEEILLLSAAIQAPEKTEEILSRVPIEDIKDNVVREVFKRLSSLEDKTVHALLTASETEEERALISRLSLNPGFDLSNLDKNIDDCIKKITMKRVEERIKTAELAGDLKLLTSLLSKRQRLLQEAGWTSLTDRRIP